MSCLKPRCITALALAVSLLLGGAQARAAQTDFGDLHLRWIGPAVMGGRLDAVSGVPGDPNVIYLGHSSAGLWKSTDAGLTFSSAFEAGKSSAIGAVTVDPRNRDVVYVGTGEAFPRNTAAAGDGVWKTRDGGKSWTHLGLDDSGSIAKIAIDPADERIVLVAAMGHEFGPSTQRGIYRTSDGGAHWSRVLYVNPTTGGSDIAFDPRHPNVVYSGTFDFLRQAWTMRSGGPGSGLWKSTDAGKNWTRLTDANLQNGLPHGPINRVGVSVCASNPRIVYAFVPVRGGMLYRTTDGGAHWSPRNASQDINFRPFYFSQVRCDPSDPNRVYAIAGSLLVSTDGGKKFKDAGGGGDNHDLWIDPSNPNRLLNGSDMGFHFSLDRGRTWSYDDVVPFDQVYRVGYDFDDPYHVMGGMQDHEVWWGPSDKRSDRDGVGNGDWLNISDWGDGQYAMADPRDSTIVYENTHFGDLVRLNLRTQERRYISPQPIIGFGTGAGTYTYRFNWSAPLLVSRLNPDTIYFGGNVLFKSTDQGDSWSVVSPDLTHCDPAQLGRSGGPISYDNTNAEAYCTIYSVDEDARDPQTLWIGTDNGRVALTRDGGKQWNDVTDHIPVAAPLRIYAVSASPSQPGVAYIAADRHQQDDYGAYAFVTRDYGAAWTRLGSGLSGYVHVVREDPRNHDVIYAGTETGLYVSLDGGTSWDDLRLGLPHVPVYDLQVHPRDNDLIVGTHGRGFYVLDDLAPLQELARARASGLLTIFTPPRATRFVSATYHEHGRGAFVAQNRPYGAMITFYLARTPVAAAKQKPKVEVQILDDDKKLVDAFEVDVHPGINRTVWDLRTLPPSGKTATQDARPYYIFYPLRLQGPQVTPGTYSVRIAALGTSASAPITVRMDPKHPVSAADLRAQQAALETLLRAQEQGEVAVSELNGLERQIDALQKRTSDVKVRDSLDRMRHKLDGQLDTLRNAEPSGYRSPAELVEQIAYLRDTIEAYDGPPTQAQNALIERYAAQMTAVVTQLEELFARQLPVLNGGLRAQGLQPLIVRARPPDPQSAPPPDP
ncbi:MAG: VPS10 domain-containing protein [Vulcanimicrobiaceae bacterium]